MKYFPLLFCASFVAADFGIGLCPTKPQTLREFDQERVRSKVKWKADWSFGGVTLTSAKFLDVITFYHHEHEQKSSDFVPSGHHTSITPCYSSSVTGTTQCNLYQTTLLLIGIRYHSSIVVSTILLEIAKKIFRSKCKTMRFSNKLAQRTGFVHWRAGKGAKLSNRWADLTTWLCSAAA